MYVSFLMPFVDRGAGPLHRWIMLAQMSVWSPDEICFLGDEETFSEDGIPFGETLEIAGFEFSAPTLETYRRYRTYLLDVRLTNLDSQGFGSNLKIYTSLLTKPDAGLTAQISAHVSNIVAASPISTFLTWSNCPSLTEVAQSKSLPVIHNELGPLRPPGYRGTIYWDLNGVNGSSTPSKWTDYADIVTQLEGVDLSSEADLVGLLTNEARMMRSAEYQIGVATQVEDDSNTLAYSNGWDAPALVFASIAESKDSNVLIRSHPGAQFRFGGNLAIPDASASSWEFVGKCKKIVSINSSILAEALLFNIPYRALGDTSLKHFDENGSLNPTNSNQRLIGLNAYFLGYLVPAEMLFNKEYYHWRLQSKPTLGQLVERHRQFYESDCISPNALPDEAQPTSGSRPDGVQLKVAGSSFLAASTVSGKISRLQKEIANYKAIEHELKAAMELERHSAKWLNNQLDEHRKALEGAQMTIAEMTAARNLEMQNAEWLSSQLEQHSLALRQADSANNELYLALAAEREGKQWLESKREEELALLREELERSAEIARQLAMSTQELGTLRSEYVNLNARVSTLTQSRVFRALRKLRVISF